MYYFWFSIHWLIVLAVLVSPFYLDWKIILLAAALHFTVLQKYLDCPLTGWQFKGKQTGFIKYYLKKMNIGLKDKQIDDLIRYWIPVFLIVFSIFWQEIVK